jgi:hypothetical protein
MHDPKIRAAKGSTFELEGDERLDVASIAPRISQASVRLFEHDLALDRFVAAQPRVHQLRLFERSPDFLGRIGQLAFNDDRVDGITHGPSPSARV